MGKKNPERTVRVNLTDRGFEVTCMLNGQEVNTIYCHSMQKVKVEAKKFLNGDQKEDSQ